MHGFKSAILVKLKNCQNGHAWNLNFFLAKSILLKQYENDHKIFFHNMSQGPPKPGFMHEKVQKGDFKKKALTRIVKLFLF